MSGRLAGILIRLGVVLAVVGAITAGCLSTTGRFPGDSMDVRWNTPADRTDSDHGNGVWLSGDTLVRSRFDAVTGFDARTGKRAWEYVPPGRSEICGGDADEAASVLVVVRDAEGRSEKAGECATAVAIDLKDGRELWRTGIAYVAGDADSERETVVAAGGVAVLGERVPRAVDVRTGKVRWTAAVPKDCSVGRFGAAERRVAAVLACGGVQVGTDEAPGSSGELHAAAFDSVTGALLWSTPLSARRPLLAGGSEVRVVSADPLVVAGPGAYYSFGKDGRAHPAIDYKGDYGAIGGTYQHTAPVRFWVAVDDNRLYALGDHNSRYYDHTLVAFDLATGEVAWGGTDEHIDGVEAQGLLVQDGKATVLTEADEHYFADGDVFVFDAATGEELDNRGFHDQVDGGDALFDYRGLLIVGEAGYRSSPFTAYERS
ncbi:PQQ-binding-like beta-propeller repeat protein [Streptomyces sp. NPDC006307]|uniref:outer membrane protein assembly factor BamB family protein n=1 Tax=Streptomyces sp. NPDC006307 TaxID=3156748 RepID=UPI0033BF95EA